MKSQKSQVVDAEFRANFKNEILCWQIDSEKQILSRRESGENGLNTLTKKQVSNFEVNGKPNSAR